MSAGFGDGTTRDTGPEVVSITGPELSVVIACFNAESTLGLQLDALSGQLNPVPFEVILCDNGCTDGSVQLALSYRDRLDVRVVDASARRGPAYARNRGVDAARASLIAFCDADDQVTETWVARMAAALRRDAFVAGRVSVERLNHAKLVRSRGMEQQWRLQPSSTALGFEHAGAGNLGLHRDAFLAVHGFDVDMLACEDTDLCMKMQLAGHRLRYAPEVLIHTRMRDQVGQMIRQGYQYGLGQAQLEHRYGRPSKAAPHTGGNEGTGGAGAHTGLDRILERVRSLRSLPLSGQLWQIGWSVGHRAGQRRHGPDATTAPSGVGWDQAIRG